MRFLELVMATANGVEGGLLAGLAAEDVLWAGHIADAVHDELAAIEDVEGEEADHASSKEMEKEDEDKVKNFNFSFSPDSQPFTVQTGSLPSLHSLLKERRVLR